MSSSFLLCREPFGDVLRRFELTSASSDALQFGAASVHPWTGLSFSQPMEVCPESTSEADYKADIRAVVEGLRARGGKTVICRQICGTFADFDLDAMVDRYFNLFPGMFCFCFYHPVTGYWMGASPELLLTVRGSKLEASTRALAGTRRRGAADCWSRKNIEEHEMVTADMCRRITDLDLQAVSGERYNFAYGDIEHLCTPIDIKGDLRGVSLSRIIDAIHPTPAVGGYPRPQALADIAATEHWPRNCYGGYISLRNGDDTIVYVVLRCVHFDRHKWAVYTGSGITADSDADDEWRETAAKAAPLLSILSPQQ